MCTKTSYTKYKRFQQFSPTNFFEFVHILAVCSERYVTSQEDMNDSHFLPLDIVSKCIITSVLFLWGNNLNEIVIDAGLDLVLESYP